jgi:hypothetical protein
MSDIDMGFTLYEEHVALIQMQNYTPEAFHELISHCV